MGKTFFVGALMLVVVLVVRVATSHSDVTPPPSLPSPAPAEPITGTPIAGDVPSQGPAHTPFTPYPIGPAPGDTSPKPFWLYDDLSPSEKAVIDKARDVTGWQATNDIITSAAAEHAHQAAADAAAHQLGVDNLGTTGVIP